MASKFPVNLVQGGFFFFFYFISLDFSRLKESVEGHFESPSGKKKLSNTDKKELANG